jgi:uncharacterized membrane protein (UPF0127 family)
MTKTRIAILAVAVALFAVSGTSVPAWANPLLTYPLTIEGHSVRAEVANTEDARRRGLMFRKQLPESHGMIFIYPERGRFAMWMKNTPLPLSVAFIDERGRILNIEDMEPFSEQPHFSAGEAKYALEVNQGWFARRDIRAGAKVEGLERLPPPK